MADYTPLISRAVGALAENTGEARRAVYERARTALLAQLRGMNPPLPEEHITRERMALEDAIRKVEADNAGDSLDAMLEREFASLGIAAQKPAPISISGARTVSGAAHDAQTLGDATAQARRSARDQLTTPEPAPEAERIEPSVGGRSTPFTDANDAASGPIRPRVAVLGGEAEEAPRKGKGGLIAIVLVLILLGGAGGLGWYVANNHPDRMPFSTARAPAPAPSPAPATAPRAPDADRPKSNDRVGGEPAPAPQASAPPAATPPAADPASPAPGAAAPRRIVPVDPPAVVLPPANEGASDPQAASNEPPPASPVPVTPVPVPTVPPVAAAPAPAPVAPAPAPVVPPAAAPTAPPAPAGQVARAALFEETPGNAAGTLMQGTVVWRTQTVSVGPGQPPDLALLAEVTIPERRMTVTMTIRRNLDQTLPASHTIEILYALPRDFQFGGVAEVPGVLMKVSEQARGVPLVGQAVRVTNGFFFVGLSGFDMDRTTTCRR